MPNRSRPAEFASALTPSVVDVLQDAVIFLGSSLFRVGGLVDLLPFCD
jgi:hypothetical protein